MKKWYFFYITLLITLLVNGYFGIYKEWIYFEAVNIFGISVLSFGIAYEQYLKKKWKNAFYYWMDKNKFVKIVSIITGAIMIVVIGYFVNEGDWNNAGFFSFLFLGIWIIPAIWEKLKKK